MKIGIDARFLTHPQCGGFKTYSECLIAALALVDPVNQYILYLDRVPEQTKQMRLGPNFEMRLVAGSRPLIGMPWREQFSLPRQVARDRLDILHSPALTAPLFIECPLVLTLHDMLWYLPDKYATHESAPLRRRFMSWYYKQVAQAAARSATIILTVSYASKADIVRALGVAEDKVIVTYEAAHAAFRQMRDLQHLRAWRERYQLPPAFVLALASADARKNTQTLIRAYALLPSTLQKRFPLVIVWTHELLGAAMKQLISNLSIKQHVLFRRLGPDPEDMALLYNATSLFVFPSLYEGFGLPPLEAMACGSPVIAAKNSSIPEILGDGALFFDGHDAEGLAALMIRVLADEELRRSLVQKGLERARGFSWERCARVTLGAYARSTGRKYINGCSMPPEFDVKPRLTRRTLR